MLEMIKWFLSLQMKRTNNRIIEIFFSTNIWFRDSSADNNNDLRINIFPDEFLLIALKRSLLQLY